MKIWYKVTEIPADVLLEWSIAFYPEAVDLPEHDFRIQAIYQRQRISICKALNSGDPGRIYLELFFKSY